ncbi:MAG: G5 domain-containing protein, partial [Patescibacteria group bacterium]|nr:G5 domain-containing protein [Patescibacteria group bacterium]
DNFKINIYRARPVTIVDEGKVTKIKTPYQGAKMIAEKAGLEVHPEDKIEQTSSSEFVSEQILGEKVVIDRANKVDATIFGEQQDIRTHSITVADLLVEKGIVVGENERLSVPIDTIITDNMTLEIWREGKQTITVEEAIARPVNNIKDNTKPFGFKEIKAQGSDGKKSVTYQIEIRNGKEYSRTELSSEVLQEPVAQEVIVGVKSNGNGLSQAKGVNQFTDSNGVTHRETYYDLPMRIVMGNCGAGGYYTVREDGAKVDKDGYVIIAANLRNYPRCSVVETSLGLGKVYDTGGFAVMHPHGYDLATDWSKRDGI